jgi:hypothetical protein
LARLEAWQTLRVADRQRLEDLLAALGQLLECRTDLLATGRSTLSYWAPGPKD